MVISRWYAVDGIVSPPHFLPGSTLYCTYAAGAGRAGHRCQHSLDAFPDLFEGIHFLMKTNGPMKELV